MHISCLMADKCTPQVESGIIEMMIRCLFTAAFFHASIKYLASIIPRHAVTSILRFYIERIPVVRNGTRWKGKLPITRFTFTGTTQSTRLGAILSLLSFNYSRNAIKFFFHRLLRATGIQQIVTLSSYRHTPWEVSPVFALLAFHAFRRAVVNWKFGITLKC